MPYFAGFNMFNPFHAYQAMTTLPSVFPYKPRESAGTPIHIKASSGDPGATLTAGPNSVTIRGTSEGPRVKLDLSGYVDYEVARGMGFGLDVDKAPTEDVFGRTNYTEKNSRSFGIDTQKGWSAMTCAKLLADKVNKGDDFRATVKAGADGSATIEFERR